MWYYDRYDRYQPAKPKPVKGGIKAQSRQGAFGKSWWSKRWIAVLESFQMSNRLARGRSYARSGRVLSLTVDKGSVQAKVQGSMPSPYRITIKLKPLAPAQWRVVAEHLNQTPLFLAKLLAGEMPNNIEELFGAVHLSLLPAQLKDLTTDCSCPDSANPCKHVAAVYYLLGEEFDRDPFLIFKLRGMTREEFLLLLDHPRQESATLEADRVTAAAQNQPQPVQGRGRTKKVAVLEEPKPQPTPAKPAAQSLTANPQSFWGGAELPSDLVTIITTPPLSAILPKQLGNFPFWRGEENLMMALEPVYHRTSQTAAALIS